MLLQVFAQGKKYYNPTIVSNFDLYLEDLKDVGEDNYNNVLLQAIKNNDAFMRFYAGKRLNKKTVLDLQKMLRYDYTDIYCRHFTKEGIAYQINPAQFVQDEQFQKEVFTKLKKSNALYKSLMYYKGDNNDLFKHKEYDRIVNENFIDEIVL